MAKKGEMTVDRVRQLLSYDPETGLFTRLITTASQAIAGMVLAGSPNGRGYLFIMIDRHRFQAHHLAWVLMKGEWPPRRIDHEDTNTSNNRWVNLRLATPVQNQGNRRLNSNNKTGLKGVSVDGKKWRAVIGIRYKTTRLGVFDCPAAAHFAYLIAADIHFGEFARAA